MIVLSDCELPPPDSVHIETISGSKSLQAVSIFLLFYTTCINM